VPLSARASAHVQHVLVFVVLVYSQHISTEN